MNKRIMLIALVITLLSGTNAYAACTPLSCAGVYVEKLYVNSETTIYVGTSGDETQLDCSPVSGVYTTLNMNDTNGKAIYATLLAAQIADKKVQIRIDNGSSNCEIRYVTLDRQ